MNVFAAIAASRSRLRSSDLRHAAVAAQPPEDAGWARSSARSGVSLAAAMRNYHAPRNGTTLVGIDRR